LKKHQVFLPYSRDTAKLVAVGRGAMDLSFLRLPWWTDVDATEPALCLNKLSSVRGTADRFLFNTEYHLSFEDVLLWHLRLSLGSDQSMAPSPSACMCTDVLPCALIFCLLVHINQECVDDWTLELQIDLYATAIRI
jgi:hypothetical protein